MTQQEWIRDLIILGRTEPQYTTNHGITVCTAGLSLTKGLTRIYPLPWRNSRQNTLYKRWSMISAPVCRREADTRVESWRIGSSGLDIESSFNLIQKVKDFNNRADQYKILQALVKQRVPSFRTLNDQRLSLGVCIPDSIEGLFSPREAEDDTDLDLTLQRAPVIPRLKITYSDGAKTSRTQLSDWGAREFLRSKSEFTLHPRAGQKLYPKEEVWNNLKIGNPLYKHILLLGNMYKYRNKFLVIACFPIIKPTLEQWMKL